MNHNEQVEALQEGISIAVRKGIIHALFPLARNTKRPVQKEWQLKPPYSEPELRRMVSEYDLGLRCGPFSGIIALDDDQAKHGKDGADDEPNVPEADRFILPPSGFRTLSPLGSEHRYYHHVEGVSNGAGKIAPYVDHRSANGYVVWVGSGHPYSENLYTLIEDGELGTLPVGLVERLTAKPPPKKRAAVGVAAGGSKYADAAFVRELDAVQAAPEGTRNDQLNRSAFSLGTLIGGGLLDENEVISALESCFPGEHKAAGTIQRGVAAGIEHPRGIPETTGPTVRGIVRSSSKTTEDHRRPNILSPGGHTLLDDDVSFTPHAEDAPTKYEEQNNAQFCEQVLDGIQRGALYRRGGVVGEIIDNAFLAVSTPMMQSIIDNGVRIIVGRLKAATNQNPFPIPTISPVPCTPTLATMVLAYAASKGDVRELVAIAPHPVYTGQALIRSSPGWNPTGGIYQSYPLVVTPLPIDEARELLEELVCDFAWATPSDRTNYFGLLLTPILRHAINDVVPMHLVEAADVAAGKTLLASGVLGGVLTGQAIAASSIGRTEDEAEKRVLAMLLKSTSIANFDNLTGDIDSESITKLITSTQYEGRILGKSQNIEIPNRVTVVATGNNVHHNVDMGRRIVKIVLQASPAGLCYTHDPLVAWIADNRQRLLGALLGLVEHWRSVGSPRGGGYPSFERWASIVSGVLAAAGWDDHRALSDERKATGDTFESELELLVELWWGAFQAAPTLKNDIMDLARTNELFEECFVGLDKTSHRCSFGRRVISRVVGRVTQYGVIRKSGRGKNTRLRLVLAEKG